MKKICKVMLKTLVKKPIKLVGPGKKSKINNHRDYRVTGMGKEKIHEQMS